MRIAVVGGTGLVGQHTTKALAVAGHESIIIARSAGVDVYTGTGLDAALAGADAVIDVTSTPETDPAKTKDFFATTTSKLLDAEKRAGIGHHVLLSIVGVDRVHSNGHYVGKQAQEQLVQDGPVPWTIQRATQFFDFAATVVSWSLNDGAAAIPPLLVQPVAVSDVAKVLVELAAGAPQGRATDLAGPETQDLVDMARRTLAARGDSTRLIPTWQAGPLNVEMAGEVLLPGSDVRLGETRFEDWLGNPES